jgi:hypothetical protein
MVDHLGQASKLVPRTELLQSSFDAVRLEHGLIEVDQVERWLTAHRMTHHELAALLIARFRWHAVASEVQPVALGVKRSDETVFWLLDALRVSGLYPRARALLEMDPDDRRRAAQLPDSLARAVDRDFDSDEPGALRRSLSMLGS